MMCTVQPNAREELLETLDTETVFDYLLQHGVLDNQTVQGITGVETRPERNAALLKHIEDYGTNAVALFINALRQSGQLRLASSIDDTKRIKPVEGSGYFERQRHKGQVTIKIDLKAVKVVRDAIVEDETDSTIIVDKTNVIFSPNRTFHKSLENMMLLESSDYSSLSRGRKILEFAYGTDDGEKTAKEKKQSCFCFCFSQLFCCKKKSQKMKTVLQEPQYVLHIDNTSPLIKGESEKYQQMDGSKQSLKNGKYVRNQKRKNSPESDKSPSHPGNASPNCEVDKYNSITQKNTSPKYESKSSLKHDTVSPPMHEIRSYPKYEIKLSPIHESKYSPMHEMDSSPKHEVKSSPRKNNTDNQKKDLDKDSPKHNEKSYRKHEGNTYSPIKGNSNDSYDDSLYKYEQMPKSRVNTQPDAKREDDVDYKNRITDSSAETIPRSEDRESCVTKNVMLEKKKFSTLLPAENKDSDSSIAQINTVTSPLLSSDSTPLIEKNSALSQKDINKNCKEYNKSAKISPVHKKATKLPCKTDTMKTNDLPVVSFMWREDRAFIQEKAKIFYSVFDDMENPSYVQLIKYFEQDRCSLVLDMKCEDCLVVVNICMKHEQLEQLQNDYATDKLNHDIERCLVTEDILLLLDVHGVTLQTLINVQDFLEAEGELR